MAELTPEQADRTPEQEAWYALVWDVSRSELSVAGQLEYDRLRPVWEKEHPAWVRERGMTRRALGLKRPPDGGAEQDEPQARIKHVEAIIRNSLGWTAAVLLIFVIIAIPTGMADETNRNLPVWMWCAIGIAAVMVVLFYVLAFMTDLPRRIAATITSVAARRDRPAG